MSDLSHLPTPGVTEVGGGAPATPVHEAKAAPKKGQTRKARRHSGGDIAQAAIDAGLAREITPDAPMTPGVKPTRRRSILEIPLNNQGGLEGEFGVAKFTSKDGETYRIRYGTAGRDGKMKLAPNGIDRLQWAAFREIVLATPGAEAAINVFNAMKLSMADEDGKPLFPITIQMLRNSRVGSPGVVSQATHDAPLNEDDEDELDRGFSLGSDEG